MSKNFLTPFTHAFQRMLLPAWQTLQTQWQQLHTAQRQRLTVLSLCIPALLFLYGIQHQWQVMRTLQQQYDQAQAELEQLQWLISQAQSPSEHKVALAQTEQKQALENSLATSLQARVMIEEGQDQRLQLQFQQTPSLEFISWLLHAPKTLQLRVHELTLERHRGELGPQGGVLSGSAVFVPSDSDMGTRAEP